MKIKEKLAEINESIYQKFLANRRELFRLCSFFCSVLCAGSLFGLWLTSPDGRPLEKVLMDVIRTKFLVPGIRPYQTENMYAVIQREIKEQEVLGIGTEKENPKAQSGKSKSAGRKVKGK